MMVRCPHPGCKTLIDVEHRRTCSLHRRHAKLDADQDAPRSSSLGRLIRDAGLVGRDGAGKPRVR
jgi:hypothetical protein